MSEKFEITVNDKNFKKEVIESNLPVLVDFWAEWCSPCRMIAPVVEEIAKEYKDKLKVCKLNVEHAPQTSASYGIMNIPTLMIFKGGEVKEKIVGVVPKSDLIARISGVLKVGTGLQQ